VADARAGGKRTELEEDLASIEEQIVAREGALAELVPQWKAHRAQESEHRRSLDEARGRLAALYAKRGRLDRFRSRSERDAYLRSEIASMEAHGRGQTAALQKARSELTVSHNELTQVEDRLRGVIERAEEGRGKLRELSEELGRLAEEKIQMTEKRKDLWREDAKLSSAGNHAMEELRSTERLLASMMDKVGLKYC